MTHPRAAQDDSKIQRERAAMAATGRTWCEVCGASPRHKAIVATADGGHRCVQHKDEAHPTTTNPQGAK